MYFEGMTRYQAQHHPAALMLALLLFGPFILAAVLLYAALYVVAFVACLAVKLLFGRIR